MINLTRSEEDKSSSCFTFAFRLNERNCPSHLNQHRVQKKESELKNAAAQVNELHLIHLIMNSSNGTRLSCAEPRAHSV